MFNRLVLLTLLLPTTSPAQTAAALRALNGPYVAHTASSSEVNVRTRVMAPRNAWAGAQVAFSFGDEDTEFAEQLNVAGQVALQYWTPPGKITIPGGGSFQVPFLGNISRPDPEDFDPEQIESELQQLSIGSEGIHIGIGPNIVWPLPSLGDMYAFTVYGFWGSRWNGMKNAENETVYLRQTRYAGGLELALGGFELAPEKPGSVGVEMIHLTFDADDYQEIFGISRAGLTTLEVTGILPLTDEIGVLLQNVQRLGDRSEGILRVGVILNPATPTVKNR